MEEWNPIFGFNGRYFCSTLGRIKSVDWRDTRGALRKGRIMKQQRDHYGYMHIFLTNGNFKKINLVHRLIAIAFLGLKKGKDFVNHKNGKKDDNRIDNLEWVTKSENSKHSFVIGTQDNKGMKHPLARYTDDQIREIRERHTKGESAYKLSKEFKMSYTNAKDIVAKRTWSHIC